jgi:hypothetical protein
MFKKILSVCLFFVVITSCNSKKSDSEGDWIKGTESEKIKTIEKQFRGFDNAMVETGYRYQELYWAGQDTNWEYAKYQLDKIKIAIENGLQRRPLRAKSAEYFLTDVLPAMQQSVDSRDTTKFNKGFLVLTTNCNNCHAMEKVPFFTVKPPIERQSSIRK